MNDPGGPYYGELAYDGCLPASMAKHQIMKKQSNMGDKLYERVLYLKNLCKYGVQFQKYIIPERAPSLRRCSLGQ